MNWKKIPSEPRKLKVVKLSYVPLLNLIKILMQVKLPNGPNKIPDRTSKLKPMNITKFKIINLHHRAIIGTSPTKPLSEALTLGISRVNSMLTKSSRYPKT